MGVISDGAQTGRRRAEALLGEHLRMLRGYLRSVLVSPSDADDVAQDVCFTVLRDPETLLRGDDPGAYLRGIARHMAHRHFRRIKRPPVLEELIESEWQAPVRALEAEAERRALAGCLERLTERVRTLVFLRYDEGLNATEIAGRLAMTADGVRMALMRARQALGLCLAERLGQPLAKEGAT